MTDFHTHILPGIDDGAENCDVARKLLAELKNENVDKVVFTSHFYWRNNTVEHFLKNRAAALTRLQTAGIPDGMEIYLGAEAEFNEICVDPFALSPLAIDGGKYILLELPFENEWQKDFFDNLTNFIYTTRKIPVIAHIERYPAVRKKPSCIANFLGMGCLIQVNTRSILRSEPGSLVDALFKNEQVHCLGSDCHNLTTRCPAYAAAIEVLTKRYGTACVKSLQSNMEKILRQEKLKATEPHTIKKTLFGKYK